MPLPPAAATVAATLFLTAAAGPAATEEFHFQEVVIDPAMAGDCKMAADIDGDGMSDLVVGGAVGEGLVWYRYPDWRKTKVATPDQEFSTDGAAGDVDGDGDDDIVIFDGDGPSNVLWFENVDRGASWRRHVIGSMAPGGGAWGKDVELADYDGDGRLDAAVRSTFAILVFFQQAEGGWTQVRVPVGHLVGEGLFFGDVDNDGMIDLVASGVWLRNPGGSDARRPEAWSEFRIGSDYGEFKASVADIDGDGRSDVVFSSSENQADVIWWSPGPMGPRGDWNPHVVVPSLDRAHTVQAADMDGDGDTDLVLAQMHTSTEKRIMILDNLDGKGTDWKMHVIATFGLHNGVVVDIGRDGTMDLFGANWSGNPPVRLWLNRTGRR